MNISIHCVVYVYAIGSLKTIPDLGGGKSRAHAPGTYCLRAKLKFFFLVVRGANIILCPGVIIFRYSTDYEPSMLLLTLLISTVFKVCLIVF